MSDMAQPKNVCLSDAESSYDQNWGFEAEKHWSWANAHGPFWPTIRCSGFLQGFCHVIFSAFLHFVTLSYLCIFSQSLLIACIM